MKKYIVIVSNVVMPGVGSLWAGKAPQGALQLLIAILAILLWMTGSLRIFAILFFVFAWIWGMFTAMRYKRHADQVELYPVTIVERRSRGP
mgnify:CR=1 FL=1